MVFAALFGTLAGYTHYFTGLAIVILYILLFLISCTILIVLLIKNLLRSKLNDWNAFYALSGILLPIGMTVVGIIISVLIRPIFQSKYMVPGLACLWLGTLIACEILKNENIKAYILGLVLIIGLLNVIYFANTESRKSEQGKQISSFLKNNEDAIYVSDDIHMVCILEELSGNESYLWREEVDSLTAQVYDNLGSLDLIREIYNLFENDKKVFFVDTLQGDSVQNILTDDKVNYLNVGEYHAESSVKVYLLMKKSK